MTNRLKLFTESVAQMGVQKPELEALTKLFKVCLENAIGLYDDLDPDEAYYEDDNENDLTIDNEDESIDDDIFHAGGVDASTLADNLSERTTPDPADDIAEFEDEIPETKRTESTAGTTLADAYVKVAPKLLDKNLCKPSDIDNMGKFIDWLINKFNSFDSDKYMRQAESIAGRRNSYNTDRMDKCLSVIGSGTYVVQLLNDIAAAFHDKLRQATLSSESSIFSLAKDINNFVANQFDATVTSDISTYEKGFYDTSDDDSHEATPEERMAAEKMLENPSAKDTKQKSNVDRFSSDTTVESVDTSLADFVSFIPSSDMSDRDAADFNKPISKEKKKRAKLLTNQRAAFANAHKGDVVETSSLDAGDDPWADL